MAIPEAFQPRQTDGAQVAKYAQLSSQLMDYAQQAGVQDRATALVAQYAKHPWLSPGIATAYVKWKQQVGTQAAQQLAGQAFAASQTPGAGQKNVQQALDDFVATNDFKSQVKAWKDTQGGGGSWFSDLIGNTPIGAAVKATAGLIGIGQQAVSQTPLGNISKDVTRATFTALESPYQEVQAGAMSGLTGLIGPVGDQATPAPAGSEASKIGAAAGSPAWEPTSVGAFALQGQSTGSGFFPAGPATQSHEQAVRNIASLTYGGQQHFATPGRLFASTVTQPGTAPFNALSGTVDALAIMKSDPANLGLTALSEVADARKGFDTANQVAQAGGLWGNIRAFVHGPTVSAFLDNPNKGGAVLDYYAKNYASNPDKFAQLLRSTGYKYPTDVYTGIASAPVGDTNAIRQVLEPALGTSIDRQPQVNSFAMAVRNTTNQHAMLASLPAGGVDFSKLQESAAPLRDLHNFALGIGLNDQQISRSLYDIATSSGRVARSEAVMHYFNMERDALVNKGVPLDQAKAWVSRAFGDVSSARTYFDGQIGDGTETPGVVLGGSAYPIDKPFLASEHLGDHVNLPSLTGKDGRGQLLARYGRILGIKGTGVGETGVPDAVLDPNGNPIELEGKPPGVIDDALHQIQGGMYKTNTAAIHAQNVLWKPLALIRGAWTVRVIGEEQLRMAMAGYGNIFTHPISYLGLGAAKTEGENPRFLDAAQEQGALRNSTSAAFGMQQDNAYKRISGKLSQTYSPADRAIPNVIADNKMFHVAWGDTLTRYSQDPMMGEVARAVASDSNALALTGPALSTTPGSARTAALDDVAQRFWDGNLAGFRADLSKDPNFLANGIDLSTQEGANAYIDGLYDRLHYYTQGNSDLINTVATGKYAATPATIGTGQSLKNQEVIYDGRAGTVVDHKVGSPNAKVLFHDENNVHPVSTKDLEFAGPTGPNVTPGARATLPEGYSFRRVGNTTQIIPTGADVSDYRNIPAKGAIRDFVDANGVTQVSHIQVSPELRKTGAADALMQDLYDRAPGVVNHSDLNDNGARFVQRFMSEHPELASRTTIEGEPVAAQGQVGLTQLLTHADGVPKVDPTFVAHLHSMDARPDKITTNLAALEPAKVALYDKALAHAFAGLMDIPITKLNRSHIFLDGFYTDLQRLLPSMTPDAQEAALAEAKTSLLQAHETGIFHPVQTLQHPLEASLKGRYQGLVDAAASGTGALTKDEAELIAKGKAIDQVKELLYDTSKRNKALQSAQLLAPFGEAWKQVLGSWARTIARNPQTIRKIQIGVAAAQGANPFGLIPGAVPDYYKDKGFIYKDPSTGSDQFFYPFSLPYNEAMTGVSVGNTGDPTQVSMAFELLPGVGPGLQIGAGLLLNRYMNDPKWDPVKHFIAPYGGPDISQGLGNFISDSFAPAWLKKVALGWTANPKGTNQDAVALNSMMGDVISSGAASDEYNLSTPAGVSSAMKDAESKARELYFLRGTFQFGAPAAPSLEFFAQTKNHDLVPMTLLRDELVKLYQDPKTHDNAVQTFLDLYGSRALYATSPKTLGESFGQQYTKQAYDWERTHSDVVSKYPLSAPEFAPRAKKNEPMDYSAFLAAMASGQRTPIDAKERVARTQNVLGAMQYDKVRKDMGLKPNQLGSASQQAYLEDKRNQIHAQLPGWRRVAVDTTRVPAVVEELTRAANDPAVYASNPGLSDALHSYVQYRQGALDFVKQNGGGGDFNRPGYASGNKWANVRNDLRNEAQRLGRQNPQFMLLWQDTFAREMVPD